MMAENWVLTFVLEWFIIGTYRLIPIKPVPFIRGGDVYQDIILCPSNRRYFPIHKYLFNKNEALVYVSQRNPLAQTNFPYHIEKIDS